MHKIVPNSVGKLRSFCITVGLREGYDQTAKEYASDTVRTSALGWMSQRAKRNEPFLTGTLRGGEVLYAYPKENGGAVECHEPAVEFSGLVSTLYNATLTDDEVKEILNELAEWLAASTNQTRVYVCYCDETWVLQREGSVTPRGDTV
ncbi:MAG TPA: hypothetical protein PKA63_09670 [Oligoflexia bacterium]|nr:hypothetical protein [Oligoflexia bacterium]